MPQLTRVLLVALIATTPALAQTTPPLSFVQPLSPAATAAVQERLRGAGVYTGGVDGAWGPESQTALDRFQQARGLPVTGSVNLATAQALGIVLPRLLPTAGTEPAAAPASEALSRQAVQNMQQRLRALGFYQGASDGVWGARTQAALERFQRGRGLDPTGQMNPVTAQALGLNPNNLEAIPR